MTAYAYKGTKHGTGDEGKALYSVPDDLPNDPRLYRDAPPLRPPYGNALRRKTCGESGGFFWHRRRNEKPCEPCRVAYNAHKRETVPDRPECGTLRGYRRHIRVGETPCHPCVGAMEEDKRQACGTMRGVGRHKKKREPLCEPCKAARREHRRSGKA